MVPPGKLDYIYSIGYSNQLEKGGQKEYKHFLDSETPYLAKHGTLMKYKFDDFTLKLPAFNYITGDIE